MIRNLTMKATTRLLFAIAMCVAFYLSPHDSKSVLMIGALGLVAFGNSTLTATAALLCANSGKGTITLKFISCGNPNAALVYLQFFDASAANQVTVGTTNPAFWVAVPATSGAINIPVPTVGYVFKDGIVMACTTTPTGSAAPGSACPTTIFTA